MAALLQRRLSPDTEVATATSGKSLFLSGSVVEKCWAHLLLVFSSLSWFSVTEALKLISILADSGLKADSRFNKRLPAASQ